MAYLDQMEWKGCISAAFERGGTFSAAHRDFLPGTTWTQLPLADHPYEVLNILTPCEDTDIVTIDSSIVGVISATEVTMHWTGERLHPSDALCACYLKIVVRSPKNDDGQFGRSIQNLRNLTTSLRHTGLSGHPFPLITEDGNGILLYHRLFDTDNSTYHEVDFFPGSMLYRLLIDADHIFLPVKETDYAQIKATGYKIVENEYRYNRDMELTEVLDEYVYPYCILVDEIPAHPMGIVRAVEGYVIGVAFIVSGTGGQDICGEMREIVTITKNV